MLTVPLREVVMGGKKEVNKKLEELKEKIKEKSSQRGGISINQSNKSGTQVAIVGDGNNVYLDRLSSKELRTLRAKLRKWAEMESVLNDISIGTALKKVYGIFNRKFKLTSYKELPPSKLPDANAFIEGQINKVSNKLLRRGIHEIPKHEKILQVHLLRGILSFLKEEDFITILKNQFGKVDLSLFSVKELDKLLRILRDLRKDFNNLGKYV